MSKMIAIAAALLLSTGISADAQSLLYGALQGDVGGKERMIQVDPSDGSEAVVCSFDELAPSENSPNAAAYDPENNRLYFSVNPGSTTAASELWYCTPNAAVPEQEPVQVGGAGYTLDYFAAGAAYHEGGYYYFRNDNAPDQEELRVVTNLNGVPSETSAALDFALEGQTLNFRGGDLAFLVCGDEQTLYASSLGSVGGTPAFFRLDLAPPGYVFITGETSAGFAAGKQLAFASVGGDIVLFSHSTGAGAMGIVDLGTGVVTPWGTTSKFTDITSATRCEDLTTVINIKPYSWPNGVNACSQGATPVIIWGSNTLDVTQINPYTLTLGTDGIGNGVKGVGKDGSRLLCSIEDVGSPDLSPSCLNVEGCDGIGLQDGIADLSCKFNTYGLPTTTDGSTTTAEVCFSYAGDQICVEQEIKLTCDPE